MTVFFEDFENASAVQWTDNGGGTLTPTDDPALGWIGLTGGDGSGGSTPFGGAESVVPDGSTMLFSVEYKFPDTPANFYLMDDALTSGYRIAVSFVAGQNAFLQLYQFVDGVQGAELSNRGVDITPNEDGLWQLVLEVNNTGGAAVYSLSINPATGTPPTPLPPQGGAGPDINHPGTLTRVLLNGAAGRRFDSITVNYPGDPIPPPPSSGGLMVKSGSHNVTLSSGSSINATTDLHIAAPHDVILTGNGAAGSGYYWPPGVPFAGSQIVLSKGDDPITGQPNTQRLNWAVTTPDTPRDIWTGYVPNVDEGDTANGGQGNVC